MFTGSLALLLSSCSGLGITLPDTKVCAVAGRLTAGMDCANTISPETSELSFAQAVEFLEPQPEFTNAAGVHFPARGAALCQSAEDWTKLKTVIEQACLKLGKSCTKEAKENIAQVSFAMDGLQKRVLAKRRKHESGPVVHPVQKN